MNKFIKNKKRGKRLATSNGHILDRFIKSGNYLVARCKKCSQVLYTTDGEALRTYGKLISGDTTKKDCPERELSVAEIVEIEWALKYG